MDAETLWEYYQQLGRFWQRVMRVSIPFAFYIVFCFSLNSWIGDSPYTPARGSSSSTWCYAILMIAVFISIFLAFWIIDAASLCRWLIERFSQSPTRYPRACLRYFASQHGLADLSGRSGQDAGRETTQEIKEAENNIDVILAEWIDMQLIAELTARVGQLIQSFPFIVFSVMPSWPATTSLTGGHGFPFSSSFLLSTSRVVCAASMIILRNAAFKARDAGLENLPGPASRPPNKKLPSIPRPTGPTWDAACWTIWNHSIKARVCSPPGKIPSSAPSSIPSGGSVLIEVLSYLFH